MSPHDGERRQAGPEGGGGAAGAALAWVSWCIVSAALWLALVDNTHVPELIVGGGVALMAATCALVVRQQRRVVLRGRVAWLRRAWRPLALYPVDLVRLVRALPARRRGKFLAIPIDPGGDDPRAAGRRVLMQAAGSFNPNTYVLGTDDERGLLLVHQLVPGDDPASDADPLGLL